MKTLPELIAYAKANPGKISCGTQGFGTGHAPARRNAQARSRHQHRARALSRHRARCSPRCSPARSRWPSIPAPPILPHIQAGKLRPLAVVTNERSPKLPDVPTTAEVGYPKLQLAVLARRGGAGRHAARDHRQAERGVPRKPATIRRRAQRLDKLGAEIKIDTPETFGKMIDELELWRNVVDRRHRRSSSRRPPDRIYRSRTQRRDAREVARPNRG